MEFPQALRSIVDEAIKSFKKVSCENPDCLIAEALRDAVDSHIKLDTTWLLTLAQSYPPLAVLRPSNRPDRPIYNDLLAGVIASNLFDILTDELFKVWKERRRV